MILSNTLIKYILLKIKYKKPQMNYSIEEYVIQFNPRLNRIKNVYKTANVIENNN